MSESIYMQVEQVIAKRLHVAVRNTGPYSRVGYRYPVGIELGDIVLRDSDCGTAKPVIIWTPAEWADRVERGGLHRQVGFWDFTPADNPAASCIRHCHENPQAAGCELYELRKLRAPKGEGEP